jgi:hypothetical protein
LKSICLAAQEGWNLQLVVIEHLLGNLLRQGGPLRFLRRNAGLAALR